MDKPIYTHFYIVDEGENAREREYCTGDFLEGLEGHVPWGEEDPPEERVREVTCPTCLHEWAYYLAREMRSQKKQEQERKKKWQSFSRVLRDNLTHWREMARSQQDHKTADEMTQALESIPEDW